MKRAQREPPVAAAALGDLERAVMDIVWATGEAPVRTVLCILNARPGRDRAYTTVMTVMANLARKGLLTRRREGRTDLYSALVSRDCYAEARARYEIEGLVSRYGDVALAHFAREIDRLDPERRRRLEKLVDE